MMTSQSGTMSTCSRCPPQRPQAATTGHSAPHVKISETQVIAALESLGIPWHRHFALTKHLVGYEDDHGREFVLVIEDDELNSAAVKYLIRSGKSRIGQDA